MSGSACVAKKLFCNPPAKAKLDGPDNILRAIAQGLIPRELADKAGLADYLMRCAYLDEENAEHYEEAELWFVENLRIVEEERPLKPLPPPDGWEAYAPHATSPGHQEDPDDGQERP